MYAGAIKLVGTEAVVGVKLDGKMVASGGDIQLDANGHLSLAQTTAAGAVDINAQSLDAHGTIYAGSPVQPTTKGAISNPRAIAARAKGNTRTAAGRARVGWVGEKSGVAVTIK